MSKLKCSNTGGGIHVHLCLAHYELHQDSQV